MRKVGYPLIYQTVGILIGLWLWYVQSHMEQADFEVLKVDP